MSGGIAPPQIRLIDKDGKPVTGNTLPKVGAASAAFSLPVILAQGPQINQTYKEIPKIDKTNNSSFMSTVIKLVDFNVNRRYLKIINNGGVDIELWNNEMPLPTDIDRGIPRGEVLFANGSGIVETDTCRIGAVYATCTTGISGVLILEG